MNFVAVKRKCPACGILINIAVPENHLHHWDMDTVNPEAKRKKAIRKAQQAIRDLEGEYLALQ